MTPLHSLIRPRLSSLLLVVAAAGLFGCSDRPVVVDREGRVVPVAVDPVDEPSDPPPPEPVPVPASVCGEAGGEPGFATYQFADQASAASSCLSDMVCTVCPVADGRGPWAVYQYESIGCRCPEVAPAPEPTPEPLPEPEPTPPAPPAPATCGEAGGAVGHATYDIIDEQTAQAVCDESSDHCTICDQRDNSGRFVVYQYESIDCVCPAP